MRSALVPLLTLLVLACDEPPRARPVGDAGDPLGDAAAGDRGARPGRDGPVGEGAGAPDSRCVDACEPPTDGAAGDKGSPPDAPPIDAPQPLAPPDHVIAPGTYDPMKKVRGLVGSSTHVRFAPGQHTWSQPLDWDDLKGKITDLVLSGDPGGKTVIQYGGSFTSDLLNYQPSRPDKLPTVTTLAKPVAPLTISVAAPKPTDEIGPFGAVTRDLALFSDATTIEVVDAAQIAVGDLIYITQKNDAALIAAIAPPAGWPVTPYKDTSASIRRVLAHVVKKTGNTLQLEQGVMWAFGAGAAVRKLTDFMSGFVVRDLTIEGADRFGVVADSRADHTNPFAGFENDAALRVDSCRRCRFERITLRNLPSSAIQLWYHLAWRIDDVTVDKVHNLGGGGSGYCFYHLDAYHGEATGLVMRGFRHGVVTKLGNSGGLNRWTVDSSEKGNTFDYHGCAGAREVFRVKQVSNRLNGHRFTDYDFPISSVRTWIGGGWPPGWPFNETSRLYVENADFQEARYHYPKLTRGWDPVETDDIYGDRSLLVNAGADGGVIAHHGGRRFDVDNPDNHDDVTIRITHGTLGARRNDHRIRVRGGSGWRLRMDHVGFAEVRIEVTGAMTKIYQDGPASTSDKHAIRMQGVEEIIDKLGARRRWDGAAWQSVP